MLMSNLLHSSFTLHGILQMVHTRYFRSPVEGASLQLSEVVLFTEKATSTIMNLLVCFRPVFVLCLAHAVSQGLPGGSSVCKKKIHGCKIASIQRSDRRWCLFNADGMVKQVEQGTKKLNLTRENFEVVSKHRLVKKNCSSIILCHSRQHVLEKCRKGNWTIISHGKTRILVAFCFLNKYLTQPRLDGCRRQVFSEQSRGKQTRPKLVIKIFCIMPMRNEVLSLLHRYQRQSLPCTLNVEEYCLCEECTTYRDHGLSAGSDGDPLLKLIVILAVVGGMIVIFILLAIMHCCWERRAGGLCACHRPPPGQGDEIPRDPGRRNSPSSDGETYYTPPNSPSTSYQNT